MHVSLPGRARRPARALVLVVALAAVAALALPAASVADNAKPQFHCISTTDGNGCSATLHVACPYAGTCQQNANVVIVCKGCSSSWLGTFQQMAGVATWYKLDLRCGTNCTVGGSLPYVKGSTMAVLVATPPKLSYEVQCSKVIVTYFPLRYGTSCKNVLVSTPQPMHWENKTVYNTYYTCAATAQQVITQAPPVGGQPAYMDTLVLKVSCPSDNSGAGGDAVASVAANTGMLTAAGFSSS